MEDRAEELRLEVQRCREVLAEARRLHERSHLEAREHWTVQKAQRKLDEAYQEFMREQDIARLEAVWIEQEDRRQKVREPPSLQQLVEEHGTPGSWDKITAPAWIRFDAAMAAWKMKIRNGEFASKIWRTALERSQMALSQDLSIEEDWSDDGETQ